MQTAAGLVPVACCVGPRLLELRGHFVRVTIGGVDRVDSVASACAGCLAARLASGATGLIHVSEKHWIITTEAQSTHAREAIGRGAEVDARQLPDPINFTSLGLVGTVHTTALFSDWPHVLKRSGNDGIRAAYRQLFGLTSDVTAQVEIKTPLHRRIFASQNFVEHVFDVQGGRDGLNDDHVMYAPLTPATLLEPNEVWLFKPERAKRARMCFLRMYYDNQDDMHIYHVAVVYGSGELRTSFRLGGGLEAFRARRIGKLLFARY